MSINRLVIKDLLCDSSVSVTEPQHQLLFSKQRCLNPAADESSAAPAAQNNQRLKSRRLTDVLKVTSRYPVVSSFRENQQTRPCVRGQCVNEPADKERRGGEENRAHRTPVPGSDETVKASSALRSGHCFMSFHHRKILFLLLLLYSNRMERRVHGVQRRSPLSRPRALLTGRSEKRRLLHMHPSSLHPRPLIVPFM